MLYDEEVLSQTKKVFGFIPMSTSSCVTLVDSVPPVVTFGGSRLN